MKSIIKIAILIFPFIIRLQNINGQTTYSDKNIKSKKVINKQEILEIIYEIEGKNKDLFNVEIIVIDTDGNIKTPTSITGDIGKNIKGAGEKKIIWKVYDDKFSNLRDIYIQATPIPKETKVKESKIKKPKIKKSKNTNKSKSGFYGEFNSDISVLFMDSELDYNQHLVNYSNTVNTVFKDKLRGEFITNFGLNLGFETKKLLYFQLNNNFVTEFYSFIYNSSSENTSDQKYKPITYYRPSLSIGLKQEVPHYNYATLGFEFSYGIQKLIHQKLPQEITYFMEFKNEPVRFYELKTYIGNQNIALYLKVVLMLESSLSSTRLNLKGDYNIGTTAGVGVKIRLFTR